ncbi:MAG: hypothetical protein R2911_19040 [Caldilineaceae bacterium]
MKRMHVVLISVLLLGLLAGCVTPPMAPPQAPIAPAAANCGEPGCSLQRRIAVMAPPNAAATADELAQVQAMLAANDDTTRASRCSIGTPGRPPTVG